MAQILDWLDWLSRAGGMVAVVVGIAGFMFREKWKQILKRSLLGDIEQLKSQLIKDQQTHAASLLPQLEQVKHDFQAKLEAYKVTLIAEAEAAKAKEDLRKSIALRYAETEFERLVALEKHTASIASTLVAQASMDQTGYGEQLLKSARDALSALDKAATEVAMFLEPRDLMNLQDLKVTLATMVRSHIGPNKSPLRSDDPIKDDAWKYSDAVTAALRKRIITMGRL